MLVDAHYWPPPEPEPAPRSFPWRPLLWPALMVAFLVAGHFLPPLLVFVCVIGALYCGIETFLRLVPLNHGMQEYRQ